MRPVRTLLASSAVALLLAGCGGQVAGSGTPASPSPADNGVAAQSADEILAKAKAALQGAGAVRIKGSAGRGDKRSEVDLRYAGSSTQGTVWLAGEPIEMRRIGQTVYVKGSRQFWTGQVPAPAVQLLTGKWLKGAMTSGPFVRMAPLADLSKAVDGMLDPSGTLTKGERKTVAGTPAIALVSTGGEKFYVATTGKPYPLEITSTDPKEPGRIAFTDFGKRITVSPPPADLVLDVSKVGG